MVVATLCCAPVATWAYMRPAKIFETLMGVSCTGNDICTDDPSRYRKVAELYDVALAFVATSIGPFQKRPLVVFCASEQYFQFFGFKNASVKSVGVDALGWRAYDVQ